MIYSDIKLISNIDTAYKLDLTNQSKILELGNSIIKQIKNNSEDFYQKYYTFRLIGNTDNYYLRAKLLPFGANQINIESMEIRSYDDFMNSFKMKSNDSTLTKLEFVEYLERFPTIQRDRIHLDENDHAAPLGNLKLESFVSQEIDSQKIEEENSYSKSDLTIENSISINRNKEKLEIDKSIKSGDVLFNFSLEMIDNINGERGENHKISLNILEQCIVHEAYYIINMEEITSEKLVHYYKVLNEKNEFNILNIIVRPSSSNKKTKEKSCTLITAYYIDLIDAKSRWKKLKTEMSFQNWIDNLTIIYDN